MPALLFAALLAQGSQMDIPTITVSGTAEIRAQPDMARLSVGVVGQAKTAREAQAMANARAARLIAALTKI